MFRRLALAALPLAALSANAHAETPISTPDFVTAAAQSDQFEIQEGQLAAKKGSPAVKTFGEHMVRDHTKNSAALMAAVSKAGMIAATPPLRTDQLSMITELQNLSGAEFDRAYVKQQLQAHQQALALVSTYAKSGDTAPIRAVAQEATPVVQMHLNMLEKMAH